MKIKTQVIIMGILGLLFIGGILWANDQFIKNANPYSMNDFCKDNGFEKRTDSIYKNCGDGVKSLHIECDKEKIFITHPEYKCGKEDKWGRCLATVAKDYVITNMTCIN